ncbi:MAG: ComF family protein [Prevotella sp.]|jgi:ComF family protein|nr:phosphoribosyltransferase family protein [Prevotella sp.]MCI2087411.1 ComF family protein [Prevotella sp.]MCI2124743.1 ComF family protein [Prevotella sp.]
MTISLLERILSLIAPRTCAICGGRLAPGEDMICSSCNYSLPRTYQWQHPYDNEMAKTFWGKIPVERAAAWIYHHGGSQEARMIYALKYQGHREFGEFMGKMVAEEIAPSHFFEGIDAIVPIPLARKRLRQRGYNQSDEIARGISESTGIPVWDKIITRSRFITSQTEKDRWERADNVEGLFQAHHPGQIRGCHLLLTDDICTTGATLTACARALQKAGGKEFSILTLGYSKS